eukprot:scaffold1239_cov175-Pinguiococcus_pyrenoidosus.AAC.10
MALRKLTAKRVSISDEGAVETSLGEEVSPGRVDPHWIDVVAAEEGLNVVPKALTFEAGPDPCERENVVICVRGHGISACIPR